MIRLGTGEQVPRVPSLGWRALSTAAREGAGGLGLARASGCGDESAW